MVITNERKWPKEKYTIGVCFINEEKFCNTLEDTDRGLTQDMPLSQIKKRKVYAHTAIPKGTYKVKSYFWPKYRKYYPMIMDVPGFKGILIHGGNSHTDTAGCILLGENREVGKVCNCEKYVRKITAMVQECEKKGEEVIIKII